MDHNPDDRIAVHDGRDRNNKDSQAAQLDFITVNGVCQSTDQPWTADANTAPWPKTRLLEKFPLSRLIVFNPRLDQLASWHSIINAGEDLLYSIRGRVVEKNSLVFICHGIGGIVALQAVSLLKSRHWQASLPLRVAGIVTFGTPIAGSEDPELFCTILESCAALELGLDEQVKFSLGPPASIAAEIEDLRAKIVSKYPALPFLAFYEGRKSTYKRTLIKRKRMVGIPSHLVSKTVAALGSSNQRLVESDRDHATIANIARTELESLITWLQTVEQDPPASPSQRRASGHSEPSSRSETPAPGSYPLEAEIRNTLYFEEKQEPAASLNLPNHALLYYQENPHFVGRTAEINALRDVLLPSASPGKQRTYAIWGKGGVGKTQLALKFAFENRGEYQSILWARADTEEKLLQSYSDYTLDLGLVQQRTKDTREARDALLRWYAKTNVNWLLIFDNADDLRILADFWPSGSTGSILVTSRDHRSATSISAGQGTELLELDPGDAVAMMEALLGRRMQSDEELTAAKSIARKVEYLPLAINSAVGTILETRCTLDEFSTQWDKLRDIIADSDVRQINRPTSRYEFSLKTAWASSLVALNAAARFLLEIICILDPDSISDDILKSGSRSLTQLRGPRLLRSTGVLLTSSLISANSEKNMTRYHIHRVIRAYVYSEMAETARQAAFDAALLMIMSVWPFPPQHDRTQGTYWVAQEKYLSHVKSLQMIYNDSFENEQEDNIPPLKPTRDFCRLLNSAAWYCYTRGLYQTSYPLLGAAEKCGLLCAEDSPENKELLVDTWQTRGAIATEAGDFELSLKYFSQARECIEEMITGGYVKRPDTREAQIAGGLGNSYHLLGNPEVSLEWYLKALELWTAKNPPIYATILCRCLIDLGRLDEASDRLEHILAERKAQYGPDDTVDYKTGQALYILGNVRIAQGRLDDALQVHLRALKQWKATYGLHHRHTAYACYKVASILIELGQTDDAVSSLRQALDILESGSERRSNKREIARTLFTLGTLLGDDEGGELVNRAIQLRAEVLGERVTDPSPNTKEAFDRLVSPWAR